MRFAFAALVLFVLSTAAPAEDFCANRPGLATGTCVLGPSTVQFESSLIDWSTTSADGERTRELTLAASMLRVGIGQSTELQFAWTPWTRVHTGSASGHSSASGIGDAILASKTLVADGPVSVAVAPFIKLPLARRALGNGKVEAGLLAPVEFELPHGWGVAVSPELDWNADGDGRGHHAGVGGAVSLGHSLTSDLWLAFDVAAARDFDPAGHSSSAIAGVSLAWQAQPTLQLDVEADAGLHGDEPGIELVAGFSWQL
jgi:hypothetical protein